MAKKKLPPRELQTAISEYVLRETIESFLASLDQLKGSLLTTSSRDKGQHDLAGTAGGSPAIRSSTTFRRYAEMCHVGFES
jgi:hypothetical protein